MKELKAGIVGAGGIADYHISGYLKSGVSVCAIADIDTKRAEEKEKKFNIKNIYSSYKEMLEKEKGIDVVSVCVPNKYHAEVSI
jgi:Predicted dehydrogenases and related proteins